MHFNGKHIMAFAGVLASEHVQDDEKMPYRGSNPGQSTRCVAALPLSYRCILFIGNIILY